MEDVNSRKLIFPSYRFSRYDQQNWSSLCFFQAKFFSNEMRLLVIPYFHPVYPKSVKKKQIQNS